MHEKTLKNIGLTDGEVKVYLSLLKIGTSTVGPIVHKANVAYSNVYDILERLIEKGLVTFIIKAKTKYFAAVEPERLFDFVEKKEKQFEENKKELKKILPELNQLTKFAGKKSEAEVFVGMKGLYSVFDKILYGANKKDEYIFFHVYEPKKSEMIDNFFMKFDEKYKKLGIKMKGLATAEYKKSIFIKKATYTKMRYTDLPMPSDVDVYQDKVIFTSWKTPIAIFVRSDDIADNFRRLFYQIWDKVK